MKLTLLSEENAKKFYAIHSERPFFNDLISYMTSGPIVAAVLQKENAIDDKPKLTSGYIGSFMSFLMNVRTMFDQLQQRDENSKSCNQFLDFILKILVFFQN